MADLFNNLDPFIANESVKALSFFLPDALQNENCSSCTSKTNLNHNNNTNAHRERRPRIVQVLHAQLFNQDCPPYLIISDGAHCVHLFLPSTFFYNEDESIQTSDIQQQHHDSIVFGCTRNKAFIGYGSLIKIQNYTIVPISQCCKDYFSFLQPLPHSHAGFSIHPTVCWAIVGCRGIPIKDTKTTNGSSSVAAASYLPLIQILGSDGSNIFGDPIDVHEYIDLKRVLKQLTYETMIQRLLACHWHYSFTLVPGSYLEWPQLQNNKRRRLMNVGSTIGLQRPLQPPTTNDINPSHPPDSSEGISSTKPTTVVEDSSSYKRISQPMSIITSEQEVLLSIYRSFESTEVLQSCNKTQVENYDRRAIVVDPHILPDLSSIKARNVTLNPISSSNKDTAPVQLAHPEHGTMPENELCDKVDNEHDATDLNTCPFPSISEMLYDDDGSTSSSISKNIIPFSQASNIEDTEMVLTQQGLGTIESSANKNLANHKIPVTKGNIDSHAKQGAKTGFKVLQYRAKLRKLQYYFIQEKTV